MGVNWANTTARRFALVAACAALAVAGMAAGSPAGAETSIINPSLARIEIDIWPEFDKASAVLVILRGEIAADMTLPAQVSVRIPTSSGGPIAVAEAAAATDQLLELPYQRADVQVDFMTIVFSATNRFIHVEFYDPLKTEGSARAYKYLWPGDFSAAQVTVQVQEPAGASEVSVSPALGAPVQQADGLFYRQGDLGALELGKGLAVDVGYQRTEIRTSTDILGLGQGAAASSGKSEWTTTRLLVLGAMGAASALLVATALVLWRRQVARARAAPTSRVQRRRQGMAGGSGSACGKCSSELQPGARFCPSCGHPVKAKH
jgi:hypothetical protein